MNNRIKEIRKHLGITQEEFSSRISLSRNFIAQIECGTKTPSDRTISDICREFEINEEWLRTGNGEMFVPETKDEQISKLLADVLKAEDKDFRKRLILALSKLDDSGWDTLENLIDSMTFTPLKETDQHNEKE